MGAIYTPGSNLVANIQNRRGKTAIVENLKVLNVFDNLIRTPQEYGDTLEHIQTALSESESYDPKATLAGNYKETVLNKFYNVLNFSKVYYTPTEEYKKALASPSALASLVNSVTGKQLKAMKYDQYNKFVNMLETDTDLLETTIPDFTGIESLTKDQRDDLTEKFLQVLYETILDMGFYSNKYITVDATLTAPEKARMIATAPTGEITVYLNAKYFSWVQVDLSKRFRNMVDLGQQVNVKIVNFTDDSRPGYITHTMRYQFVPKMIQADEIKPFAVMRTDHALVVEGTYATVPAFPGTVLAFTPA